MTGLLVELLATFGACLVVGAGAFGLAWNMGRWSLKTRLVVGLPTFVVLAAAFTSAYLFTPIRPALLSMVLGSVPVGLGFGTIMRNHKKPPPQSGDHRT